MVFFIDEARSRPPPVIDECQQENVFFIEGCPNWLLALYDFNISKHKIHVHVHCLSSNSNLTFCNFPNKQDPYADFDCSMQGILLG